MKHQCRKADKVLANTQRALRNELLALRARKRAIDEAITALERIAKQAAQ